MPNELDPIVDQWYTHRDKGQRFYVVAIDEDGNAVEIQHFDGDLEELGLDEWRELAIELSEEPENWAGALDIADIRLHARGAAVMSVRTDLQDGGSLRPDIGA